MTRHAEIKVNEGAVLLHLARIYPRLFEVILEIVQNALDIDVRATRIWIYMSLQGRTLTVRDNGQGTSVERFNAALASIAQPGRKGEGGLGQFAIGLVSPLGKCKRFVFTSCMAPNRTGYNEWVFNTENLTSQSSNLTIPMRQRLDLAFGSGHDSNVTHVPWRSAMELYDLVKDDMVTRVDMDELAGAIVDRFGTTMHKNKVTISIIIVDADGKKAERSNVTASGFKGTPLPELILGDKETGKTIFRLFVASQTVKGRNGKVLMGVEGSDFRFPFHYFARSTEDLLPAEVTSAINSGLFEGEIISERAKLMASRRSFERNDDFKNLCDAIKDWFSQCGRARFEELKEARKEQRYQQLGLCSINVLQQLLLQPENDYLRKVIESFNKGTIGDHHFDLPSRSSQGHNSVSLQGTGRHVPCEPGCGQKPGEKPDGEKKGHMPFTVAGTRGCQRRLVKKSSFGLQLLHEAMEGSPDLWKLNCGQGILSFNIRHPLWTVCDEKSDTILMKLQEFVVIQALTLHAMPENLRQQQRMILDELTKGFVSWLLMGDRVRSSGKTKLD